MDFKITTLIEDNADDNGVLFSETWRNRVE